MNIREIRHAHFFCGLGGGAKGFNKGSARVGNLQAKFRCLGGIDVDRASIRDFERMAGVPGTVLDLFSREQYRDFHNCEPPASWREATTADVHRAFGFERPHIVFLSAPCKGFSGLLSNSKSASSKYQALNGLTLRGVWLMLEAYRDDLPELIVFENVPRIASRGRWLLDQIVTLLRHYGYAVAETTHDCGHLGGLAQSRKRFLLVARHVEKVPSFLYEPTKRPLRAVGDVLSRMPLPGDPAAGPMHRIPALQWKTWVRLAFVQAGSDWRSLNRLAVENGFLRDYAIVSEVSWRNDVHGVLSLAEHCGTVAGESYPTNGFFSIASPVPNFGPNTHENIYRVVSYNDTAKAVTGATHTAGGAPSVADVRCNGWGREANGHSREGVYGVVPYDQSSSPVLSRGKYDNGPYNVADPMPHGIVKAKGNPYYTAGSYGVVPYDTNSGAVSVSACHDNGFFNVADQRLPEPGQNYTAVIIAEDGTWHRPFTTLELAALQSLIDPEEHLELEGLSDAAWRERIGNAVPPEAATAIAGVMGEVLLLTWAGETFSMSRSPIWVRPMIAGLMAAQGAV